jgi:hypothetical protein
MVFSQDQHVFILEHYFSTQSHAESQNVFRNFFPDSVVPNMSTIQRLVERFHETGSIGEKRHSGHPSVLSNDSLEDIRACLLQSPRKSLRKLAQQTGMTYGSVQRATKVSDCIRTEFKSVVLKQFFDDRIISKNLWPLLSPDLTPPDYFL